METNQKIPSYLPVVIQDDQERIVPGKKGVSAKVNIEVPDYKVVIFVPPVVKKEPTDSTLISKGEKVTLTFKSTKDDRINASGRLSKVMIRNAGKEVLMAEFAAAAEKLWKYSNP